jgi:cell division protein FtsA
VEVAPSPRPIVQRETVAEFTAGNYQGCGEDRAEELQKKEESTGDTIKRSFFDRYVDKIKDFLDNAE